MIHTSKKSLVVSIIVALLLISGAVAYRVHAQGGFLPFGGFIVAARPCTCSGGWLIQVGPPVGGFFVYNNTPQFAYSQLPRTGVWVLGLYTPGALCTSGSDCDPTTAALSGTITPFVGTSL